VQVVQWCSKERRKVGERGMPPGRERMEDWKMDERERRVGENGKETKGNKLN
jgi:hypothetical protein